jgi:acylphosphatase
MSSAAAELKVNGLVQGVGYRYFFYRRAVRLELTGWVRNAPDGSVFGLVERDKGSIEALVDDLKIGPPTSKVTGVDVHWVPYTGRFASFDVAG